MIYSKIKKLLTEENLSVPQLAEKIGMTKGGLYAAIENNTLSVKTLEKIAEVFNVPITSFFEDENDKWNKQALIDEFNKLDKKNKELTKLNDEFISIIGSKRAILRFIYMNIRNFQDNIIGMGSNEDIKSFLVKMSQGLKLMEYGINESENFDIDVLRMKGKIRNNKMPLRDETEEYSSKEVEFEFVTGLDNAIYGSYENVLKAQDILKGTQEILTYGLNEDGSIRRPKRSEKGTKEKATKKSKD